MAAHDHVEGACNQRTISCPLCAKTFTLWSHYEAHKKCHQKLKQRQYPCQSCGKVIYHAYFRTTINKCSDRSMEVYLFGQTYWPTNKPT